MSRACKQGMNMRGTNCPLATWWFNGLKSNYHSKYNSIRIHQATLSVEKLYFLQTLGINLTQSTITL